MNPASDPGHGHSPAAWIAVGVMLASLLHQGGLYYFYRRSLAKIDQALVPPPIPTE